MAKYGKIKNTFEDYLRDGGGLAVSGILTGVLREIGGIASIWLSPKIAKTPEGKTFNRMFAVLLTVDSFLERFTEKGAI